MLSFWLVYLPALLACWRAARRNHPVGRALLAGLALGWPGLLLVWRESSLRRASRAPFPELERQARGNNRLSGMRQALLEYRLWLTHHRLGLERCQSLWWVSLLLLAPVFSCPPGALGLMAALLPSHRAPWARLARRVSQLRFLRLLAACERRDRLPDWLEVPPELRAADQQACLTPVLDGLIRRAEGRLEPWLWWLRVGLSALLMAASTVLALRLALCSHPCGLVGSLG